MSFLKKHLIQSLLAIVLSLLLIGASESLIGLDVARTLLGTKPSAVEVVTLKRELGLDRPFLERILSRTVHAFRGDLGQSYAFRQPIAPILGNSINNSFRLISPAFLLGSILGILLGIWAAYYPKYGKGFLTMATSIALLPSLVLSTLVVYGLGFRLGWIKPNYMTAIGLLSLLPLFITALTVYQQYAVILISSYTRTTRAWGTPEWRISISSLKPAAAALVANLTNLLLYLLTATVFIEISFSLPGLGNLLLEATERLDYPVIMGISFVVVVTFSIMNLLSAIILYALDPRTR